MDPSDFPGPRPTRITRFSPSLANQLLACELRVAFARDPSYRSLRRPNTFSVLGDVAHAVSEAVYKSNGFGGVASAARVWLEERWEQESDHQMTKLRAAWAPAEPPPPVEWPGYYLTRARSIRRGERLLAQRHGVVKAPGPEPGIGVEVELEDRESGLYGRADRIERKANRTRIVDLKSGLNQGDPTTDQRRQLLLYALLAQRTTGEWPAEIAVEDASGLLTVAAFDPSEAEEALAGVQESVGLFNENVESTDFRTKASPDSERCRWCAYRVVCRPYWESLKTDWEQHRSVLGAVEAVGGSDGIGFARVRVESPVDQVGMTVHVSSLSEVPSQNERYMAIVDVAGAVTSAHVRARWSSIMRTW
jgi:RecB family exonuclease